MISVKRSAGLRSFTWTLMIGFNVLLANRTIPILHYAASLILIKSSKITVSAYSVWVVKNAFSLSRAPEIATDRGRIPIARRFAVNATRAQFKQRRHLPESTMSDPHLPQFLERRLMP